MKIECELCHATAELGEIAPRAGGMDVRCSICDGWFFVSSGPAVPVPVPAPAAAAASAAPESLCPKCKRPRAQGDSCPHCGLTFDLWKEEDAAASALIELDEIGVGLWVDLERDWENPALHDKFVEHCLAQTRLPAAGRRYRERLDKNPSDPVAAKMQNRIIAMATQFLGAHNPVPEPITRSRGFWVVVAVAAVGAALASFFAR